MYGGMESVRRRRPGIELGRQPRETDHVVARSPRSTGNRRNRALEKMSQHESTVQGDEHVLRSNVPVYYVALVGIHECGPYGSDDVIRLAYVEALGRQMRQDDAQRLAVD
jgi:hypothetical protein